MWIFILSFAAVSFISLCFFKKTFWENRYLILLIGAGVAFVATLVTNYSVRNKLKTKTEVVSTETFSYFYIPDSLYRDTVVKKLNTDNFKPYTYDSTKHKVAVMYYLSDKNDTCMCYYDGISMVYKNLKDINVISSSSDKVAYICKKRLLYDIESSNWLTSLSMPYIKTIKIYCIPKTNYNKLPKSVFNKPLF